MLCKSKPNEKHFFFSYVLSAAHCFTRLKATIARVGEHDLAKDPDCAFNVIENKTVCAESPQTVRTDIWMSSEEWDFTGKEYVDKKMLLGIKKWVTPPLQVAEKN